MGKKKVGNPVRYITRSSGELRVSAALGPSPIRTNPPPPPPKMMNRPPPPPTSMAGQQMWRPPQQMAGGHGHPPMMQMSMPPHLLHRFKTCCIRSKMARLVDRNPVFNSLV